MHASKEISSLARYLIGGQPTPLDLERFERLIELGLCTIQNPLEQALWQLCLRYPILFIPVDSTYAIFKPNCKFRKRLFYALSIFEMEPLHYHKFIKTDFSWSDLVKLVVELILYPFSLILGILLLALVALYMRLICSIT